MKEAEAVTECCEQQGKVLEEYVEGRGHEIEGQACGEGRKDYRMLGQMPNVAYLLTVNGFPI